MPDLQEPSRVLIGGMQTPEGLAAIQELVRIRVIMGNVSNRTAIGYVRGVSARKLFLGLCILYSETNAL